MDRALMDRALMDRALMDRALMDRAWNDLPKRSLLADLIHCQLPI